MSTSINTNNNFKYNYIIILIIIICIIILIIKLYFYFGYVILPKFYPKFSKILYNLNYNNIQNTFNTKDKIVFFYSYDYKILPQYSKYSIKNIKKYCQINNYTLLELNHFYDKKKISPYWIRVMDLIYLTQQYPENTIFIYLDLDTILNPEYFNIKIDILLNGIDNYDNNKYHNNNYDIYISSDPLPHLNINTGVMFIRNTKYSKKFLKLWFSLYQESKWLLNDDKWVCKKNKYSHCIFAGYEYEQGALEYLYNNNKDNCKSHIKILQPNFCSNSNYKDDSFIYHFMGFNSNDRNKYMKYIYFKNYYYNNYDKNNLFYLLKNPEELINGETSKIIPNILFQTYYDKMKIPQYIFDNVKKYAPEYKYYIYDDKDAIKFLETYFDKKVSNRFKSLKKGAHKADLLRYCFLYINGGIYLDIKTILIKPLDEIFINKTYFYSCISAVEWVYQGVLATPPRNILFLSLIDKIVNSSNISLYLNYLLYCKDMYNKIKKDIRNNSLNNKLNSGINNGLNNKLNNGINNGLIQDYYLFEEKCNNTTDNNCSKLDRYGFCCSIYDNNEKIFIGRDPSFPW